MSEQQQEQRITVIFGSYWIYQFKKMDRAKNFVQVVKTHFGLNGQVFDDGDEAGNHAMYPFKLTPPVVLIERAMKMDDQLGFKTFDIETGEKVDRMARVFGGTFQGT